MDPGKLTSFLEAQAFERRPEALRGPGIYPFVTVSREAGAGGHTFARALIGAMERAPEAMLHGWQVFDDDICRRIAEEAGLKATWRALMDEEYHTAIEDFIYQFVARTSPQGELLTRIFKTARTLAAAGKAVIIGRGGACLTRDYPGGIHVRLVAPVDLRVRTLMARHGLDRPAALARLRETDEARERLVRRHFKRDIADPLLYDSVWNTGTVAMEAIVSSVMAQVLAKARRLELLYGLAGTLQ